MIRIIHNAHAQAHAQLVMLYTTFGNRSEEEKNTYRNNKNLIIVFVLDAYSC